MAQCKRVPAFPLSQGEALLAETAGRLGTDEVMSPETLDALFSSMASVRREIHANPEPGFEEYKTQALLKKLLIEFAGIPESAIRACATTGLVADIKGTGPASPTPGPVKVVALRADMDALRMTEGKNGLPYRSGNEGVAHLCGHDGHMASLIGAATLLQRRAARLPSNCSVRLLFQPAEEGPGGAQPMIDEGCLEGVDEVYGYHNWPTFDYGRMAVCPGPIMAHPTSFKIVITGKGGHGSQPHMAVDPVLTAAHVIVALQSVVSRNVHSREQAVLSVTMVHGGEVSNVIPDTVTLEGTIRDLNAEVYELVVARTRAIVAGTCAAYGASATCSFDSLYPVLVNHTESAELVASLGRKLLGGTDKVTGEGLPIMGGEDFAYFLQHRPGCFFFLGAKEPELRGWSQTGAAGQRSNCMCHNTAFDFNDNIAPLAAVFFVRLVEERTGAALFTDAELPMPLLTLPEGEAVEGGAAGPIVLPLAKKARK